MVLGLFTVIIMAIVAYVYWREGPLTAFAMCVNIVLAGLLAFNFFEPIADLLESALDDTFAAGTEDALALMIVFLPALGALRLITNNLASSHMEFPPIVYRAGGVVFGLLGGYLLAGFLACVLQTLPLQQGFMGFEVDEAGKVHPLRKVLPPDVVWLAMMHGVSGQKRLGWDEDSSFDRYCNFQLRYTRYRRIDESGEPGKWRHELWGKDPSKD